MKVMLLIALLGAAAFGAEDTAWQVRAEMLIVQMPRARAMELVPRLLDEKSAVAAYGELRAGIESGAVKLVADVSGDALGDGAAREPYVFTGPQEERGFPDEFSLENPELGPAPDQLAKAKEPGTMSYAPRRFENDDYGARFEFNPTVLAGGKLMAMECTTEVKTFEGWTRYEPAVRGDGITLTVDLPVRYARRAKGALVFRPGVPQVWGLFQLPGAAPMTEMHLLTARLRDVTGFPGAHAQLKAPGANTPQAEPWQMRAEIHQFRVAAKEAVKLRPQLQDESQSEKAFARLLELTAAGEAELVDWQNMPLLSGDRAVCENNPEMRWGGEQMAPQGLPSGWQEPPPDKELHYQLGAMGGIGDPPNSFDLRNLGLSTEVEPSLEAGGAGISLVCAWQAVDFSNFTRWTFGTNRFGRTSYSYLPNFHARRVQQNFRCANGARMLVGFWRIPGNQDGKDAQYEITLLRATARNLLPN